MTIKASASIHSTDFDTSQSSIWTMTRLNISNMAPKLRDPSLFITKAYVNGEWIDSISRKTFGVTNPSNGEKIATIPEMGVEDVAVAARHAAAAFKSWKTTSPKARGKIVRKWAELMLENAEDLGTLMTLENGKPYTEAKGEIAFAAGYLEFYSGRRSERTETSFPLQTRQTAYSP